MRLHGLIFLLLLAGSLLGASGDGGNWQALLSNNPYAPDAPAVPPKPEAPPNVEFRGRTVENGMEYFSLYDTATKKGRWVGRNGQMGSLRVKERGPQGELVLVDAAGKSLRLALKESRPTNSGAIAVHAGAALAFATTPASPLSVAAPPDGAEVRRLEQVAEQIRSQRALRLAAKG